MLNHSYWMTKKYQKSYTLLCAIFFFFSAVRTRRFIWLFDPWVHRRFFVLAELGSIIVSGAHKDLLVFPVCWWFLHISFLFVSFIVLSISLKSSTNKVVSKCSMLLSTVVFSRRFFHRFVRSLLYFETWLPWEIHQYFCVLFWKVILG
jgi:hypothetical protein